MISLSLGWQDYSISEIIDNVDDLCAASFTLIKYTPAHLFPCLLIQLASSELAAPFY